MNFKIFKYNTSVKYLTLLILSLSFVISEALYARANDGRSFLKPMVRDLRHIYARYDIPITNDGRFGWDPEAQVPGGGRWLRGTNEGYIFGAGVWVGAIVDGAKQVSVGYNPINIQTELVPGNLPNEPGYTDPTEIVYISTDYPNNALPPWPKGYDEDGLVITVSQMDSWCQFNDLDPSQQFESGKPLGALITAETYSWNTSFRDMWDIAFISYTIKNINPDQKAWEDAYIGFAMDPDIGNSSNDLGGCFPDLNLGFAYNPPDSLAGIEEDWTHPPGYIGIKFLDGPSKDPVTGAAKMTTFAIWATDFVPNSDEIRYDLLSRGTYDTLDVDPADKRIFVSSGPFSLDYGDSVRFVIAVCFAWPAWYYDPSLKGKTERYADYLKKVAENAQYVYDNNFRFPQPPLLPRITLNSQNQRVVITWDDRSEYSVEKILSLPEFSDSLDFEGYKLWRSSSGGEGTFELLGHWDKISFDDSGNPIGENTGLAHSYVDENLTNGKLYYYAVTAYDKGEYEQGHYGDSEFQLVPPLETGMVFGVNLNAETPNAPPSNYTQPQLENLELISGEPDDVEFGFSAKYLIPDSVKDKTYQVHFANTPSFRYISEITTFGPDVYLVDMGTQDTVQTFSNFPITSPPTSIESELFNGMSLIFTGPLLYNNNIDTVYFESEKENVTIAKQTNYDNDFFSAQTSIPDAAPFGAYFLPHTYLIEFYEVSNRRRINVYDFDSGDTLDYEVGSFGRTHSLASYEKVIDSIDSTTGDTTWVWYNNPTGFRNNLSNEATGYKIYLSGTFIFIEDPDQEVVPGDKITVKLSGKGTPNEDYVYQLSIKGSTLNYKTDLSSIKVVPNPYLVRAAWDIDNDYQKIQFINLPTECTIRIYTIAGDLVKTLHHKEPYNTGFQGQTRGTAYWNLMTENNQKISTGVYVFFVESPFGDNAIGRFAVIR